ncbi:hypothetical protein KDL44_11725 [bacterium]|nr:hypothetical protein [bacterium]
MDLCKQLHDDPCVRALLWCLISAGELDQAGLKAAGFVDTEVHAILKDQHNLLRRMKQHHQLAQRMGVKELATLIRHKLTEQLGNVQKAAELSSILRCLKGLPAWLFPEWEKAELANLAESGIAGLNGLARGLSVQPAGS